MERTVGTIVGTSHSLKVGFFMRTGLQPGQVGGLPLSTRSFIASIITFCQQPGDLYVPSGMGEGFILELSFHGPRKRGQSLGYVPVG